MTDDKNALFDEVPASLFVFPEDEEKGDAAMKRLTLGKDDNSFRLEARPIEDCIKEADKTRPAWTQYGPPLRKRFKADEPFCLGRDYRTSISPGIRDRRRALSVFGVARSRSKRIARKNFCRTGRIRRASRSRRPHALMASRSS